MPSTRREYDVRDADPAYALEFLRSAFITLDASLIVTLLVPVAVGALIGYVAPLVVRHRARGGAPERQRSRTQLENTTHNELTASSL